MSVTKIIYKEVDVTAETDAAISTDSQTGFSEPEQLPSGGTPHAWALLEHNSWALDGSRTIKTAEEKAAFYSTAISDADCALSPAPVITINFSEQHSTVGITLAGDTLLNDWCSDVNIKWYNGATLLDDVDFEPDEVIYFCSNSVEHFTKIVITLNATHLPYHRAKLEHIIFGVWRTFGMTELRSAEIIGETSLIAAELAVSKLDFTVDTKSDIAFMWQAKQPVEVWNDDNLVVCHYFDTAKQLSATIYEFNCSDAFGVLDTAKFDGGVYLSGISARTLFTNIVGGDFPITFDAADKTITGVIASGTKREALHQVLFAWGCIATTDGINGIRVFSIDDTPAEIPESRVYNGTSVDNSAIVTRVIVAAHSYTLDPSGSVEIGGNKYADAVTEYVVNNPNVSATDKPNEISVTDATMISPDIGAATAQRVFDFYNLRRKNTSKIVWQGEKLGDCVMLPTGWGDTTTGHITSMDIKLSNTIAANITALGV